MTTISFKMFSRLAISNLAFPNSELTQWIDTLPRFGFSGLEIAPTKIWGDWQTIDRRHVEQFSKRLQSMNISVPALQSLLFGRPHLQLFSSAIDFEPLRNHFVEHLLPIAGILQANVMIFGSPKNRCKPLRNMVRRLSTFM